MTEEIEVTRKKRKPRSPAKAKEKAARLTKSVERDEKLIERVESMTGDKEYLQEYLYMYKSLRTLVRQAKRDAVLNPSGRNYYALCTLLSQQREVIADIRTMTDMTGQVDLLLKDVLQPFSQAMGQVIVNSFYQLRTLAKETTTPKETKFAMDTIETIVKEMTKALQHSYDVAASNTQNILIGPKP